MSGRRRRSSPTASDRLGRMLVILPYLVQHPGSSLAEVAVLFDLPVEQLRDDLRLVFLSGLPPYGPGDLIDVVYDEEDRVTIYMAEHFARPLRLTRREAMALVLRATELTATPGFPDAPALSTAIAKLTASLGEQIGPADAVDASEGGAPPPFLDELRSAAEANERLEIGYVAGGTAALTERRIDPEHVFPSLGHWYVAAWDVDADAERLFRADRVTSVARTGERFEPRGLEGAGRPLYTRGPQDVELRLRLRPGARWVAEYYETTDVVETSEGSVEVTLPATQLGWASRLLLRLGPDALVIEPHELAENVRRLASETLRRYRSA